MVTASGSSVESSTAAEQFSDFAESLFERYPYLRDAPGIRPFDPAKLSSWAQRQDGDVTVAWLLLGLADRFDLYSEWSDLACSLIQEAFMRPDVEAMLGLEVAK